MSNLAMATVAGGFISMTGVAFCRIFGVFAAVFGKKSRSMGVIIMATATFGFAVAGIASSASPG
ncbi:hypothetical protein ciss_14710 [Carboxydothermus islandicus]|uniref:Uncharacterized protein n=1 Tax=Carboxydothermus islandicus TaxID=661089 RepID=A0A1L8D2Y6_9THEO|nr:hypothetical protein ciss_14710 [Carboxydothermus islandicus]